MQEAKAIGQTRAFASFAPNADLIQWGVALQEQRTVAPRPFSCLGAAGFMNALQKFYLLDEGYPCRPRIQRRQHSDQI